MIMDYGVRVFGLKPQLFVFLNLESELFTDEQT